MKIADYEQMMAHLMRQGYNRGGYVRLKDGGYVPRPENIKKFKEGYETVVKRIKDLGLDPKKVKPSLKLVSEASGLSNTAVTKISKSLDFNLAPKGGGKAGDYLTEALKEQKGELLKQDTARRSKARTERIEKTLIGVRGKVDGKTKVVDLKGPQELIDGYIKDYSERFKFPKAGAEYDKAVAEGKLLDNAGLAKKYKRSAPEVEAINQYVRREVLKGKTYPEGRTDESEKLRKRRLLATQGKVKLSGKGSKNLHHILPIGGEAQLTTKDIAFIDKKMNSAMGRFDRTLNRIADATSENFSKAQEAADFTSQKKYFDRIEELNTQAEQVVNKAKKELPKKFQGLVGFAKMTPIVDENGTPINITFEKIGVDTSKAVKGPKVDLSKIPSGQYTEKSMAEAARKVSGPTLGANIGLLKGVGETIKAIPTPTGAVALNLAFQPDLSSGIDRAALGAEAAFAPELVRQTSRVSSAPIVQRFFNLGLSPQLAARAARVVSPLGLATLAGEGVYQLGRLGAEQRRRMQEMTPEQRRLFDAEQQSISEFAAAGGGIAKLAGKESGPPPEKGPDSEGLASLLKNVKKR